jgi:hypothetical protein
MMENISSWSRLFAAELGSKFKVIHSFLDMMKQFGDLNHIDATLGELSLMPPKKATREHVCQCGKQHQPLMTM